LTQNKRQIKTKKNKTVIKLSG